MLDEIIIFLLIIKMAGKRTRNNTGNEIRTNKARKLNAELIADTHGYNKDMVQSYINEHDGDFNHEGYVQFVEGERRRTQGFGATQDPNDYFTNYTNEVNNDGSLTGGGKSKRKHQSSKKRKNVKKKQIKNQIKKQTKKNRKTHRRKSKK
jgi:hypothetical protein